MGPMFMGPMDSVFSVMGVLFPIAFLGILAVIVAMAVRGLLQWNRNNQSPILTVEGTVVTKRSSTSVHAHDGHHHHSTHYYATFEVASSDRLEFSVSGREYGQLAEGDAGRLTFQGTRYLGFERGAQTTAEPR